MRALMLERPTARYLLGNGMCVSDTAAAVYGERWLGARVRCVYTTLCVRRGRRATIEQCCALLPRGEAHRFASSSAAAIVGGRGFSCWEEDSAAPARALGWARCMFATTRGGPCGGDASEGDDIGARRCQRMRGYLDAPASTVLG
jgi:hypothetical protein